MPGSFVLPLVLGLPLIGAILVMCTPKGEYALHRGIALTFTVASFLASLLLLRYFDLRIGSYQEVFDVEWIPGLGAHFKVGVDGLSLWLVLLTTFLMPLTLLAAHGAIDKHVREFTAAMLILQVGMIGAFVALDVFLFYVFWEVMLIPMYLLIGIWGGQRRLYASIKFVIYTMVGSLLMLVAILYLYVQYANVTGRYTTDLAALTHLVLPHNAQIWCFCAFALAFAIKIPLFPLHTWLPDAHVEAPTAGSVILAGVLLKFGIYGFLRFAMPMFPYGAAVMAPYIAILAVIGIIYGAFVAFAQDDVKKLVAYSSVSHLGFCALGIFSLTAQGTSGSVFAMLSHGLTTGGLFLGIGMLYERRHTRRLAEYGGIWKQMPVFSGLFLIITLGSAGLPGLSGFIGEFLTIFGTFISGDTFPKGWPNYLPAPRLLGALAASGVIFGAVYLLYMFQKVFFGPLDKQKNGDLPDVSGRELAVFLPLVLGIFFMGVFPRPFLRTMENSVQGMLASYKAKLAEPDGPAHLEGSPVAPIVQPATTAGAAPAAPTPTTNEPSAALDPDQRALQEQLEKLAAQARVAGDHTEAKLDELRRAQARAPRPPGSAQPQGGQP
ncbi:MAG: NADH-quinone oxidoreductase subunit M [Kofleriaceae bacterium]|nr:NADH-quinone oxidoreductase subunit M [Myxococcales bacterium]MCB9572114.1 NADH-quinone oxidoreductase subunit M [Kofleriaceae bacterium]